jgi:hydrogenase nickel incorporation protein HypA/HybF
MHEMGMCEAIVEAALNRARGRQVRGIRVRIGGHPVDRGVIEQGVRMAAAGTLAEGADLDLIPEPLAVRCGTCGEESAVTSAVALAACPECGAVDVRSVGGTDVVLESITVDAEDASTADLEGAS